MHRLQRMALVGAMAITAALALAPTASAAGTGTTRVLIATRPNPALSTAPVALYGRVKPTSSTTAPTGQVCFYDGTSTTTLGCGTLAAQANGTMQTHIKVSLAKGTHALVAKYSGDSHYAANQSKVLLLTVS
ncbi:MAG TPA: Ig-like domain-containing protein [Oryzihumus sp.]|nr:Ig-like domain-containing protein [Oryzihumus sp.]